MLKVRISERSLGILLAAALTAAWVGFGLSQPSEPPEERESPEYPDQKPTSNNPLKIFWNWTTNDAVSFYTFVLAIFTGILGTVAIVQIRYLRRADDATQRTLVLTQRPKLRIRNIVIRQPPNSPAPQLFAEGYPFQCQFFVANIGGTPATVVEAFAQTFSKHLRAAYAMPLRRNER